MQEKNKKLLQKSKAPYFYEALYDTEHQAVKPRRYKSTAFLL
jgi:hypothetical protein